MEMIFTGVGSSEKWHLQRPLLVCRVY